jgi:hypothetical protein
MMGWIFLGLAFFLSGCFAVPILAFEVTCSMTSIALRATDPDRGSRIVADSTPSPLFPGVAEGARVDEEIKEDAPLGSLINIKTSRQLRRAPRKDARKMVPALILTVWTI